jgi:hypothetical protein
MKTRLTDIEDTDYRTWMRKVDVEVERLCGLSIGDLPTAPPAICSTTDSLPGRQRWK